MNQRESYPAEENLKVAERKDFAKINNRLGGIKPAGKDQKSLSIPSISDWWNTFRFALRS